MEQYTNSLERYIQNCIFVVSQCQKPEDFLQILNITQMWSKLVSSVRPQEKKNEALAKLVKF